MLKKLFVLCFVFFASFLIANAQEANIYVTQIKIENKVNYNMGDTVRGNFTIYNTADVPQSDLFIKISTYFASGKQGVLANENIPLRDLYLEAHSKKTINFEYKLPKENAGEAMLMVQAYTSDGTIKGEDSVPISVIGNNMKTLIGIENSTLMLNGKKFELQVGPTVLDGDNLQVDFSVGNLDKTYTVKPIITIYNRTADSKPLSSTPQESISLKTNGKYSLKIPTNLDPLVYEGVLSFESDNAQIQPIKFRFITKGDIGTIINANTDVLGGEKGNIVNVKISYGGNPIAFNLLSSTSTDTSTEGNSTAIISVKLSNKEGDIIGNGESTINLKDTKDVNIPITLNKSTDNISIYAVMKKGDKILSEYNIQLPNKEKIGSKFLNNLIFSMDILLSLIILALLLAYKKNKDKVFLIMIIVLAALIIALYTYQKANAFIVLLSSSRTDSAFAINSITSPLPNDVGSYAPNEEFTLRFNATFGACQNRGWNFSAYGPSAGWWEHDASYYQSALRIPSTPVPSNGHCPSGSVCTPSSAYNFFTGCSLSKGSCVAPGITEDRIWNTVLNGSSFFESTMNGITGNATLIRDNGYYNGNGNGHWFYVPTFYIQSNTYKMPSTPGIYDFVFMTTNDSSGTYDEGYRVVSQKVCVRGAGLCIDETSDNATTTTDTNATTSTSTTDVNTDNNSSTCGVAVLENNQGLTSTSTNLCVAGQTSSNFEVKQSNFPSIYSWLCTNSNNTSEQCRAQCSRGLTYCADTNTCSSECSNGDRCSIPGIQREDDPIYALLGCDDPTLTLSVKFNKPYANEITSKCSVNWTTTVTPSNIPPNYTKCKLDGNDVANNTVGYPVSVGQHSLICETKIEGLDFATEPNAFVTSGPITKNFKCSRVPVSHEN